MRLLKEALGVLGALVVVAVLAAIVVPKRAHALVAALVQIVPGSTTHVGQNESQLVQLACNTGETTCFAIVEPEGYQSGTSYVVPSDHTLIVTDWEWSSFSKALAGSHLYDELDSINQGQTETLVFSYALADAQGKAYAHEHFASGIRVGSGLTVSDIAASTSQGYAYIQGYLVPND